MQQDTAIKIATKYVRRAYQKDKNILKAYLFGSYARNEQHKHSDIDICLVVDNFRSDKLLRIWNKAGSLKDFNDELPIETVLVTKNEFSKWNPLPAIVMNCLLYTSDAADE